MQNRNLLFVLSEVLWYIASAIIAVLVLIPIYDVILPSYLYYNFFFIITFINSIRYVLYFKQHLLMQNVWFATIFLLAILYILLVVFRHTTHLQHLMQSYEIYLIRDTWKADHNLADRFNLVNYYHKETLFFGIGSMMMLVVLIFQLFFLTLRKAVKIIQAIE